LIRKRDEGVINMCFSEAHVLEAAPTTPAAIPEAIERFRTIKKLCGKNSLIHPIDVWESELSRDSARIQGNAHVLRSDGTWMPALFDLSEIIPDIDQAMADEMKNLSRSDRRKFSKKGKPTAKAYAEMRKFYTGDAADIASRLPLTADTARIVERYFLGEASRADALKAVHDSLTDLEVFGHWYAREWSAASDLSQYLRRSGEEFKNALLGARTKFELLLQTRTAAGDDTKKFLALSMRTFQEVLAGSSDRIASGIAETTGVVWEPMVNPWQAAPGTTCSITLAMHVARHSVQSMPPRAPSHSDFPDAYHAVYLPYVDIYRADSFMANVLRECKLPLPTVIVEKFLQLPSRIEEMLDARNRDTKLLSD
jgi:hypothetical protein